MTDDVSPTTTDTFEYLLAWLDPDRETAGQRYEEIRRRLIKVFAGHDCWEPEDLADETMRRVEINAPKVAETWINDPVLYFYAVARNIRREYVRRKPLPSPPPVPDRTQAEREATCLECCLEEVLAIDERQLVLQYYQGQGREKIENRQQLCDQQALGLNALRIRMHRLLKRLRPCVLNCLERTER